MVEELKINKVTEIPAMQQTQRASKYDPVIAEALALPSEGQRKEGDPTAVEIPLESTARATSVASALRGTIAKRGVKLRVETRGSNVYVSQGDPVIRTRTPKKTAPKKAAPKAASKGSKKATVKKKAAAQTEEPAQQAS